MVVHTAKDVGALLRARRRELGLSQSEVARRADVSRQWLVAAEAGKPTLELAAVLRALAALDLALEAGAAAAGEHPLDLDDHLAGFVG
ncbi:MAG TPA: helix-turn-helix domain-containing protein [Iamia sp.]|jgi:HTH-type transcriptional regulator/antitoxin HipB|nr:helix-turn-helix domain-containing protein [Iamia sp.]